MNSWSVIILRPFWVDGTVAWLWRFSRFLLWECTCQSIWSYLRFKIYLHVVIMHCACRYATLSYIIDLSFVQSIDKYRMPLFHCIELYDKSKLEEVYVFNVKQCNLHSSFCAEGDDDFLLSNLWLFPVETTGSISFVKIKFFYTQPHFGT